jgi:hypothetical protein
MVVIALVVALGVLGAVAITVVVIIQQVEARGCVNPNAPAGGSIAVNASKGRCAK